MRLTTLILCLGFGMLAYAEAPFALADVPIPIPVARKPEIVAPGKKIEKNEKKIDLKQYRGKALVVVMISTSCKHCITAVQFLTEMQKQYGAQGLQVVGLAGDPNADVAVPAFVEQYQPNFPFGYLAKDPFLKLANLPSDGRPFAPIVLFVDPKGMVRNRMFGNDTQMKNTENALLQGIKELLAQSAPLLKK
jgi:thiol-disulfide isomerase/thioredoxin